MNKIVTVDEASRDFSKLLRSVRDGESFVVTSHGSPVARLLPIEADIAAGRNDQVGREEARQRYLARLRSQPALNLGTWTRDELYDE